MGTIEAILSYPFALRALMVGSLVSLCAALLGVVLVLKQYSMIGHALSDVGFAALASALVMGWSPTLVAMPVLVVASFVVMGISRYKRAGGDVAIGMIATGSLALGVIITSVGGGFNLDVYSYMFGSILATNESDLWTVFALATAVVGVYILLYNRILITAYDEDYSRAIGVNVTFYQFVISFLTAVTVVMGMRIMGTLLISSLIIFPAIITRRFIRSFKALVLLSALLSSCSFALGLFLSFELNLPTGASVVAVDVILFFVSLLFPKRR